MPSPEMSPPHLGPNAMPLFGVASEAQREPETPRVNPRVAEALGHVGVGAIRIESWRGGELFITNGGGPMDAAAVAGHYSRVDAATQDERHQQIVESLTREIKNATGAVRVSDETINKWVQYGRKRHNEYLQAVDFTTKQQEADRRADTRVTTEFITRKYGDRVRQLKRKAA